MIDVKIVLGFFFVLSLSIVFMNVFLHLHFPIDIFFICHLF